MVFMVFAANAVTVKDINGKYLNYSKYGIKSMSFNIKAVQMESHVSVLSDILYNRGYVEQAEQLKKLKISVFWDMDSEPQVISSQVLSTGIWGADSLIHQVTVGYKRMALILLNLYRPIIAEPMITNYLKEPTFSYKKDSVIVEYDKDDGHERDVYFNNFKNVYGYIRSSSGTVSASATFQQLGDKLAPTTFNVATTDSSSMILNVTYTINDKMIVPKTVQLKMGSSTVVLWQSFEFSNFKFELSNK